MRILTLKFSNILGCRETQVNLCERNSRHPQVYVVHDANAYEIMTMAIQMMCSNRYDTLQKLEKIWPSIREAKIEIIFTLTQKQRVGNTTSNDDDHSSDSNVPCTSEQARKRAEARQKRKEASRVRSYEIKASRNLEDDPLQVLYAINNGPLRKTTIFKFHRSFFTCTDIIFPRISGLIKGDCNQGRWLDLLSTDFIYKRADENNLILKFCELYSSRKIDPKHPICQMTTSVLIGRYSLEQTRIAHLIQIFQDIRRLFEYLTFSEFTVWFLLPQLYGDLCDIADIKTNSINFDLMQTKIQLKTQPQTEATSSPRYPWTEAFGYVRELFLVSVQLAFGHNCQQNIIYLHSLTDLHKHQSFEDVTYRFARNCGGGKVWPYKNYLQRIINACGKCNIVSVVEYIGTTEYEPRDCITMESCPYSPSIDESQPD